MHGLHVHLTSWYITICDVFWQSRPFSTFSTTYKQQTWGECLDMGLPFNSFPASPDDSPHCCCNQLVTPPSNRSTFDVTYLGALTDKWLGWAPLRNMQNVCNKHSTQQPLPLLPPLILMVQFVVLLLLLLFAGDMANPGPSKSVILVYTVLTRHYAPSFISPSLPFAWICF